MRRLPDAFNGTRRTFPIVKPKAIAVVISEIEFCKVTVQMLLSAMLIDALHAALEDREIAFDGVGVDVAAHVLAAGVVNSSCSANSAGLS